MFQEAFLQIGQMMLKGERIKAVDVGGAHGLIPHWQKFLGNADFYMYEPHEASCEALIKMYESSPFKKDFNFIKTALSGTGGVRTFYQTNAPTGSSLLRPNINDPRYANDPYFVPVRESLIRTQTLEESLNEEGAPLIDIIKLDIQGGELEVLQGLDQERAQNLLMVELEVNLCEVYENSPGLGDIQKFMTDAGLELYDIRTSRSPKTLKNESRTFNEAVFGVSPQSSSCAAKLVEVDMVFFRKASALASQAKAAQLKKMIFCLGVYNFFSEAYALATEAPTQALLNTEEQRAIPELIKTWQNLNQQLMQGYEQVLHAVGHKVWSQYTWTQYPSA